MACFITGVVVLCSFGCGKSQAELQRDAGRQKFKEAIAAIQVRTKGATYAEFRQAELDLKTSYQANSTYLNDVAGKVESLQEMMTATDFFWNNSIQYPDVPVNPRSHTELYNATLIKPDNKLANKVDYSLDQMDKDPEFYGKNYVRRGLKKVDDLSGEIMDELNLQKPH